MEQEVRFVIGRNIDSSFSIPNYFVAALYNRRLNLPVQAHVLTHLELHVVNT